jgi:hypothetical protein
VSGRGCERGSLDRHSSFEFQRSHAEIGVIGAGHIGQASARLTGRAGREVAIANSRGPESSGPVPAHITAGGTTTDDGIPMSINTEMIGDSLMIQKYVGEITDANRCPMVSISEVFTPLGRSTADVVWDLSVEPIDDQSCEYVNHVNAIATDQFLALLDEHGVPFDQVAAAHQEASVAHNEKETAL